MTGLVMVRLAQGIDRAARDEEGQATIRMCGRRGIVGLGALAMAAGLVFPAMAAVKKGEAAPAQPAPPPPVPAPPPSGGVAVQGFRSARFGMTEAQVRAAIEKDFSIKGDDVKSSLNSGEQTQVLSVPVGDLLPGGGRAVVAYVFGYQSKKLIQVGITWSKVTDPEMTPERLFSNANILREHFLASGFRPETVATGGVLAAGLLMFRGADAEGRATELLLVGTYQQDADKHRILTPTELDLRYVADSKNPDIYKLPAGSF